MFSGNNEKKYGYKPAKLTDGTLVYYTLLLFGIATGQVQPAELFKAASTARNHPHYGYFSATMEKVYSLGIEWKYGLAHAAETVARLGSNKKDKAIGRQQQRKDDHSDDQFMSMLTRMAQVIRLGDDLAAFFRQELEVITSAYVAAYERAMKTMELVMEMYSTLMSTTSFMVSAMLIMMMIYGSNDSAGNGNSASQVIAVLLAINGALAAFVLIAYILFPRDPVTISAGNTALRKNMIIAAVTSAMIVTTFMFFLPNFTGMKDVIPIPLVVSAAGAPLLLPGFKARRLEAYTRSIDYSYASFTRHFSEVYATVGSTGQALKSTLRSDFGTLTEYIMDAYVRIANRVHARQAFALMAKDTNSQTVAAGNTILAISIEKGADLREVGERLSETIDKFESVKKKRLQSAKAFESTLLIMHVLTITVFALMNRLIWFFQYFFNAQNTLVGNLNLASKSILMINVIDPAVMAMILPFEAIALAVMNAFALKVYQGGLYHTVLFNIAILMITGGVVLYGSDMMLKNMLDNIIDIKGLADIGS